MTSLSTYNNCNIFIHITIIFLENFTTSKYNFFQIFTFNYKDFLLLRVAMLLIQENIDIMSPCQILYIFLALISSSTLRHTLKVFLMFLVKTFVPNLYYRVLTSFMTPHPLPSSCLHHQYNHYLCLESQSCLVFKS